MAIGSLSELMKHICLCGDNKMKKEHNRRQQEVLHKDDKKDRLLKNDQLTLQECILNSPRSSPLPTTSNKRVYPSPVIVKKDISVERLLVDVHFDTRHDDAKDDEMEMKLDDGSSSRREKTKKRVSFRMPEVAEVFIMAASTNAHKSPDLQVCEQLRRLELFQ